MARPSVFPKCYNNTSSGDR